MALSLKQFVDNVSQSGLLSADEVSACSDSLPNGKRNDVQELAKLLVRQKKLTKYQAQAIYQGKQKALKFGEYTVLDKLGEGGMGVVLRARHGRMEREVAIKVLPAKALKSETAVDRFYKEVRAAAKLIHPNVVTAFDASEHAGSHYLVLEFVDGKDLSEVLREHGPLPLAQAVECTIQAARGLEYAHTKGLVHRDIKPANLLLDKEGTVKILDLGLARLEQEQASRDGLTKSGQIMGTVDYMSPEQARDTKHADARSDVYSLGCTLYRLLTGQPVYDGDSIMNKMLSHAQDPVPELQSVRADVPARLNAVFQKMVAKQADDRQQSMTEVIADLESALAADSPPERRIAEPSSDTALTEFFAGLKAEATVATKPTRQTVRQDVDETIDLNRSDQPTGEAIQPPPQVAPPASAIGSTESAERRKERRLLWGVAGGGLFSIVCLLLLAMRLVNGGGSANQGSDDRSSASAGQAPPFAIAPFTASEAQEHQRAWADYLGVPIEIEDGLGTKMVLIPPGEFQMGSPPEEIERFSIDARGHGGDSTVFLTFHPTEGPRHLVRITRAFYLGIYEVTSQQYAEFEKATGRGSRGSGDPQMPAAHMSWDDAVEFCEWLGGEENATYRLPTEAEWEYSCRAGTTTAFHFGDSLTSDLANFDGRFPYGTDEKGRFLATATPVGSYKPNAFKLFDMHGNQWEWCQDWYAPNYYEQSPTDDPSGPPSGSKHVLRGGDWEDSHAVTCRSALRYSYSGPYKSVGFRVVREIPRQDSQLADMPVLNQDTLFNGRDLTGWEPVGDASLWAVNDGILTATGEGTGWLSTVQEYNDFVLELDYRLPRGGNSGVFLRTLRSGPLNGAEFIEVQLYDDDVPIGNGNYTGSVFDIAKLEPSEARRPAGEWNTMEIRMEGTWIEVVLNGNLLNKVRLGTAAIPSPMAANATRSSGYIGLQCLRSQAEFRNLRITPLR